MTARAERTCCCRACSRWRRETKSSPSASRSHDTALTCILVCMRQLNLNVTPEFERDLRQYMKKRGIERKSDAIRQAVREALQRPAGSQDYDFRSWLGLGLKAPLRRKPRFKSEDDLWSLIPPSSWPFSS